MLVFLTACSVPEGAPPGGIHDPYESTNRSVHQFNKGVDRAVLRPVAIGYATVVPVEVQQSVGNFADNLATPGYVVNDILQARLDHALVNTYRFVVNSTIGIGGLVDAAAIYGVPPQPSDFGETLHVWGVPEGAYRENPVFGPSTERDTAGRIVDLFTNPLGYVLNEPEAYYGTVANVADKVGQRGRLKRTIDGVLYDSADSYAQARLAYLQSRRFELGQGSLAGGAAGTLDDPYGSSDVMDDPYE